MFLSAGKFSSDRVWEAAAATGRAGCFSFIYFFRFVPATRVISPLLNYASVKVLSSVGAMQVKGGVETEQNSPDTIVQPWSLKMDLFLHPCDKTIFLQLAIVLLPQPAEFQPCGVIEAQLFERKCFHSNHIFTKPQLPLGILFRKSTGFIVKFAEEVPA